MSQHIYTQSRPDGTQVVTTVGYDRVLGEFFMNVRAGTANDAEMLYTSLGDPLGCEADLEHYAGKLRELGLTAPQSLFDQTLEDACNNTGNRVAVHQADGTFTEVVPQQQFDRPRG